MKLRDGLLWGLVVGGEILDNVVSGGSRAYQREKLFIWTPQKYSKKKFNGLLNRMHREGYVQRVLVDGEMHFRLTGAGKRLLVKTWPVLKIRQKDWDGFWRVIIFDVKEKDRKSRDDLRRHLIKLGFGRLQDSTYITPYDFSKEFKDWLKARGLTDKVMMMECKQKHLGKPEKLAEVIWGLDKLNREYQAVIDRLSTRFGIRSKRIREEFLKKVYQQYLEVLTRDPFLPDVLLPKDWLHGKCHKYILRAGVIKEK